MTYTESIDWLWAHLPMYQEKGRSAFRGKLDNILLLCDHLGNPQEQFPSLHIAGTNGKGSSSHALASVLQEAGYKVGLYTSPHLKDFRERIKVNGENISQEAVSQFVEKNKDFMEGENFSFFEVTVGMAFDYFAYQKVDIAVIEVGLGGRLDSTNIINPIVSLITNIGKDHTEILGDTLEKIAQEKAGIIKLQTPVVISEFHPLTAPVFKQVAAEKEAPIYFADSLEVPYTMDLKGGYQAKNIKGIVQTLRILQEKGWAISEENIQKAFDLLKTELKKENNLAQEKEIQKEVNVINKAEIFNTSENIQETTKIEEKTKVLEIEKKQIKQTQTSLEKVAQMSENIQKIEKKEEV